jgi:EpsI family protein
MKKYMRVIIVVVLLACTGGYINVVLSHGEEIPVTRSLKVFPMEIGGWKGEAGWLSSEVLDILRVDDYMMRDYSLDGRELGLYVGFFKSQREGQLIHSPKHCMPGAGWNPISSDFVMIDILGMDKPIKAVRMVIQKGDRKQLVVYWYQTGKSYTANEYTQKAQLVWNALRYNRTDGSLFRVTAMLDNRSMEETYKLQEGFIKIIVPELRGYLPS